MKKILTIITPVYNELEVIKHFFDEVCSVASDLPYDFEFVFVDDGSDDGSIEVLQGLSARDNRVRVVELSRNYGKEVAMAAGLDYATGEAVIIMDADLQHPPVVIKELLQGWEEGFDDVFTVKTVRAGESWLKRTTSRIFYSVLERLTNLDIHKGASDFRLLSRSAVDAIKQYRETQRYTKGLYTEIGFKKKAVYFEQMPRFAGKSKWNYWQLLKLAIEGVTSFSILPLRLATICGVFAGFIAMCYMIWVIIKAIIWGDPVAGYPSLMCAVLFIGSLQLICTGIIGEYLGRVFKETKSRPLYIVRRVLGDKKE